MTTPDQLIIAFDNQRRLARLTLPANAAARAQIRRVCQDASDQTEMLGSDSLSLPWWALLGCRDDIRYHASRHGIAVEPIGDAIHKLAEADSTRQRYRAALDAAPLSEDAVLGRLAPEGFVRDLTPEQLRNVRKLAAWQTGATFSVPGAGKTTEALAFYTLLRKSNTRLLVVCPKNAFSAWEEQLELCLPDDTPFLRLRGGETAIRSALRSDPQKLLITYEQLPNVLDLVAGYLSRFSSIIFLDESHRIKGGVHKVRGNAVLSISELPESKLIMSGTPMPNDIKDLVPQFRFLYPEINSDENNIREYLNPIFVRTTKAELRLPELRKTIKTISLKPAQFQLYEQMRSEAARQANARIGPRDRMALRRAGRSALRLLQLASNPALLSRIQFEHPDLLSDVLAEGDSPKLEYVCYRARELAYEGKKSIIWSSFVDNVELVANRLNDLGAEFIHGQVDAGSEDEEGTREQKIKRFHDDDQCFVLVANPAACGEGISLHRVCHNAIYLDRNYNAAQYLQSEDRIHRLGLDPDQITDVEIIVAPGTVDDSVQRRLNLKINNMADVLNDPSLNPEPEIVDLDEDGFNYADLLDFFGHLKEEVA